MIFISKDLHPGQEFVNQSKLSNEYSPIFHILLPKQMAADVKLGKYIDILKRNTINIRKKYDKTNNYFLLLYNNLPEGTERSEDLLKELQSYVTFQLKKEKDAMEARIK